MSLLSILNSLFKQLHNWVGEPPNLYDISGSAHFINKCDNGIVIHRNRDPDAGPVDQVQVKMLSALIDRRHWDIHVGKPVSNSFYSCRFVYGK